MIPQSTPPATAATTKTSKNGVENKRKTTIKQFKGNKRHQTEESVVQWKQTNIKNGFVVVDEEQLTKLIKREPIEKYYQMDPEPFAKGLFASVTRCRSLETNQQFAAKFTSRKRYGEDCSVEIYHEIALLSICAQSSRIVQIHDVFETKTDIIIVMEYAPGGDLQTVIDDNMVPFESTVVSFVRQTVEGLEYLHRRKIAHLDIKPQNIVMTSAFPDCDVKLCDFEISRVILDGTVIREILGTPDYVAPEILHYEPITLAADMWSLGVTTYVLLTGFSPFGGETDQETFCNISRGELDLPDELFEDVSEEAVDFVKRLLIKDPRERLTSADCLRHPWLAKEQSSNNNNNSEILPQPLLRHDSDPITAEEIQNKTTNKQTLRKYLSKSREALFEKVIQQQKNCNNLRKNTLKTQLLNKSRLYESQMSLVSKSREKLLNGESMLPTFSRSIEKIYGLRSLSKSQEVLNLYKNGSILTSQENLNLVSELILKSRESLVDNEMSASLKNIPDDTEKFDRRYLTRATTADIGMLRHRHRHSRMYSGSSTTSISSSINDEITEDEEAKLKEVSSRRDSLDDMLQKAKEICIQDGSKDNLQEKFEKVSKKLEKVKNEDDHDEPRFTVAQLISAYNKHQEIVTKTSLEVTMTAQCKDEKIPPLIEYKTKSQFPTGPTAIRLFVPDIDLVDFPKKKRPTYKIRFVEEKSDSSGPNSGEWKEEDSTEDKKKKVEIDNLKYLRSSSMSSEASTTISSECSNTTTGSSSCEELNKETKLESLKIDKKEIKTSSLEEIGVNFDKTKESEDKVDVPQNLNINKGRSKSTSPSPVSATKEEKVRKLSAGSNMEPKNIQRKSPNSTRTCSIEKPKIITKKPSKTDISCKKNSNRFKIIGISDKSPSPSRKKYGISYKIEFDSPVVERKFPLRSRVSDLSNRTTVSSELKKQDCKIKKK